MAEKKIFDRETLLDLTVNAIPLGMLLFFVVLFLVFRPFESAPVVVVLQFSIVLVTFGALLALTYYAGRTVSLAEKQMEAEGTPGQGETEGTPVVDSTDVDSAEANYEDAADVDDEGTAETPEQ